MGDRRQMVLYENEEKDPFLYVYTHWGGDALEGDVARALLRGSSRWDDEPYLARVLVCQLVANDVDGVTGFGLSGQYLDSDHEEDVHVYLRSAKVRIGDNEWPYAEFISDHLPAEVSSG